MTRKTEPQVRVHPTESKLILEDLGVRMELDFAVAGRVADRMNALLRTFDPARCSR